MNRLPVRVGSALVALATIVLFSAAKASADGIPDVWFAGTQLVFDHAQLRGADVAVATGDTGLQRFLARCGATLSYQPGQRYVVVTDADRRTVTFTLGDTRVSAGGITTAAPFAPYTAGNEAYLPLAALARALYVAPVSSGATLVLQPQIGALDVRSDDRSTVVTLHAATPLVYRRTSTAGDRVVLTFSGVGSSLEPQRSVASSALSQVLVQSGGSARAPTTTVTFIGQGAQRTLLASPSANDLTIAFAPAGVARSGVEIPLAGTTSGAPAGGRNVPPPPVPSQLGAAAPPQTTTVLPAPSPSPAVVSAVDVVPLPNDAAEVHIAVSGGTDFEWHRLGDGRWYIDLRGTTLAIAPRDDAPNVAGIEGLRVRQFALDPVPVVRVSLSLATPRRVDVVTSNDGATLAIASSNDPAPARVGVGRIGDGSSYPAAVTSPAQGSTVGNLGTQPDLPPGSNPRLIVLDAGHGGSDAGAQHNGVTEKTVTLDIARRLQSVLSARGWIVRMTRETDTDVYAPNDSAHDELQARCDVANKAGARLFVSIHANSFTSSSLNGTTTYYYKGIDLALARAVHRRLIDALGTRDDGVRKDNFYVIHHTTMPAILIETAFLSNPSDAALLRSPEFLQRIATAIADGVADYVKLPRSSAQNDDGTSGN